MNNKSFKWIYIALSIIVLIGAYMKIIHVEYGNILLMFSMVLGTFVLLSENMILKKEIKKLTNK